MPDELVVLLYTNWFTKSVLILFQLVLVQRAGGMSIKIDLCNSFLSVLHQSPHVCLHNTIMPANHS